MKKLILAAIAAGLLPTFGCTTVNVPASPSPAAANPNPGIPVANAAPASQAQPQAQPLAAAVPQAAPQPVRPQPVAAAPAPVASGNQQVVRTRDGNGVNVRASNSTQSAIVASLTDGAVVSVQGSDRSGQWVEISAPNRVQGWVAAEYLASAGSPPISAAPAGSMRVRTMDGDSLNVRSQPMLGNNVITTVANGATVTYQDTVGQWTKISTANGTIGYVASDYLVNN